MEKSFENHSPVSTAWIESLALEELNMEESGVVQFNNHLDPNAMLEESSLKFMNSLRDRFEIFVSRFNECRTGADNTGTIKIFKISNTINDFMLYRNSLKLVVARRSVDLISVGFLSNAGGLFSARLNMNTPAQNIAHEIKAHIGAFNEITWRFQGEEVAVDSMVKHYLTEFIQHSAR
ncbi:MAG: hypothetical protein HOE90_08105 [Bacteriovoracaceae bacterium]|jgi:hypothetical protein|nr:hypothetical protein [Bacteriovoracaceae bacterium]